MSKKVAIFQNTLTGGGRSQVLNAIIKILNEKAIEPDIYTFRVNKSFIPEENLKFQVILLKSRLRGMNDTKNYY